MAVAVPVLQLGLALVFLVAGATKLAAPRAFRRTLRDLRIAPDPMAVVVPATELLAAGLIVATPDAGIAHALVGGLLLSFAALGTYALVTGRRIDCACFGTGGRLGWRQVALLPIGVAIVAVIRSNEGSMQGEDGLLALAGASLAVAAVLVARGAPDALRLHQTLRKVKV